MLRNELAQGSVCPPVDRRRSKANPQRIAIDPRDLGSLRTGVDVYREADRLAAPPQAIDHGLNEKQYELRQKDGDQRRQVDRADRRH